MVKPYHCSYNREMYELFNPMQQFFSHILNAIHCFTCKSSNFIHSMLVYIYKFGPIMNQVVSIQHKKQLYTKFISLECLFSYLMDQLQLQLIFFMNIHNAIQKQIQKINNNSSSSNTLSVVSRVESFTMVQPDFMTSLFSMM